MYENETIRDILTFAGDLGFVDAGIISPHAPAHYDIYQSWLSDGHAAGMDYLGASRALEIKANPALFFPGYKSVIVLLARYPSPVEKPGKELNTPSGRVAAYARGIDYHLILIDKLNQLAVKLGQLTGSEVKCRPASDSAPLLEREMACKAGLGWIGKNSCLISPGHGSSTFIAELFVDIRLDAKAVEIPDRCGNCHRCMDACPTKCILPNRTIAAERCISYLTIEHRGQIPYEYRSLLGDWIFGCDICQSVCPWNSRIDDSMVDERFIANDNIRHLKLDNELSLTESEFKQKFKDSPILRTKYRGYLRNIALAIGNSADSRFQKVLLDVLRKGKDDLVREAVIWAGSQMINREMRNALLMILADEPEGFIRRELSKVLTNED
jgi:epoxyqueuosine reductase